MADDTSTYPPHVLRYGDAGRHVFDAAVASMVRFGDTPATARALVSSPDIWHALVEGNFLTPIIEFEQ